MKSVLLVLSAADWLPFTDGSGMRTGFWAQEFLPAWEAFEAAGFHCTVATLDGRPAVLDPYCLDPLHHGGCLRVPAALRAGLDARRAWQAPESLAALVQQGRRFDAVFFPGGHGPVVDLAGSPLLDALLADERLLVGAVCHGQAALLPARAGGAWRFAGYRMTCFSPADEAMAGVAGRVPALLYERLARAGAVMSHGDPGTSHVVVDRTLFTGQNPQSMAALINALTERLRYDGTV